MDKFWIAVTVKVWIEKTDDEKIWGTEEVFGSRLTIPSLKN